jgi:hypothetical protein
MAAQIVLLLAAVCYAGAAIFGRAFKNLDPMAPAAGSLLVRRRDPDPAEPGGGSAVDAGAVDEFVAGAARTRGVFHGIRLRDLFPPDPDAGIDRRHRAGLFARADRRRGERGFPRRAVEFDRLDRARLCRRRCRRDDDPGAKANRSGDAA